MMWIGANATISPGVHIGHGAIIGLDQLLQGMLNHIV